MPKGISLKLNTIPQLEFELAYSGIRYQKVSNYTTETLTMCKLLCFVRGQNHISSCSFTGERSSWRLTSVAYSDFFHWSKNCRSDSSRISFPAAELVYFWKFYAWISILPKASFSGSQKETNHNIIEWKQKWQSLNWVRLETAKKSLFKYLQQWLAEKGTGCPIKKFE